MGMDKKSALVSKKTSQFSGNTKVPGDKSISHRSLMFGALTVGETIISGLLEGEDVLCTAQAMREMGAHIEKSGDGLWRVNGVGIGGLKQPAHDLDMGNSGTSTRLLIGLVGGHNISATFVGDASLSGRPMGRVIKPLEMMGASFEAQEGGRLPLTVTGAEDTLAIEYRLPVASAQVKSAVLLAGLNARGTTSVIEEKPTRDHTEKMLRAFGVEVSVEAMDDGASKISVVGEQVMQPCAIDVPGDPSSAAFPAVAAALIEGAELRLANVGVNERRNGVYRALQALGADVSFEHERLEGGEEVANIVVRGGAKLKGVTLDPSIVPSMVDEFPVFAMAAACAEGTTHMAGLAELRVKESDRLLMVANGLRACGVDLEMGEDSLTIHGTGKPPKGGAMIETALDHRIAMAFLVLGCVSDEPVEIDDGAPIATSFPNFVELMNDLGADIGDVA
jgi:3-phosphoshikimate 1-carboxyvinyltransferase